MRVTLDACVLFPSVLRAILLRLARTGLYEPVWSDRILGEWQRAVVRLGPEAVDEAAADAARMAEVFPRARTPARPDIEARHILPDPNDLRLFRDALGRFASDEIQAQIAGALPARVRDSLRGEFEWYACRGAFFHNDAHYGEVLFGAWCVAGPPREIVFARTGTRCAAGPGDWVIFDPFEPHAVLDPGADRYRRERYEAAPISLFLGFELRLDPTVREAFGIGEAPAEGVLLASSVAINAETGALG